MKQIYALDFFCGAGGLTRGLIDAGIKVIAGIDIDGRCKETYEINNPESRFYSADIRETSSQEIAHICRKTDFSRILFAGCAPCQPFSTQQKGDRDSNVATLLGEFGRLIEALKPGYVFVENVPGITKVKGNSTFNRFLRILEKNSYEFSYSVIDAKDYGIPQNRKRVILLAARGFKPSIPPVRFGNKSGLINFKTVKHAIERFPAIEAGEKHPTVPNHYAATLSDINLERLILTPKDGGDRKSWPRSLHLQCHSGDYSGHTDVYGRMYWDRPAPTLTCRCNSISNGRYGHPEQNRAISLREAAAIQTFPDNYAFYGANKNIAQQIGNAVPVKLAETFGRHLLSLISTRLNMKRKL